MFGNRRPLKVAWLRFVLAGILLATPAVKAQSSREKSAASYFSRGIEWQARGEFDRAIARFGIPIAFDLHFPRGLTCPPPPLSPIGKGKRAAARLNRPSHSCSATHPR